MEELLDRLLQKQLEYLNEEPARLANPEFPGSSRGEAPLPG
jgi:hypothetical protein